jgi:hypothetical protein
MISQPLTDQNSVAELDQMSKGLLPVLRYFHLSLHKPSSHGWRHGFETAVGTWGQDRGLAIAQATQKFVYDLMRCCQSPLHFNNPLDIDKRCELTSDERLVLTLLIYMRSDEVKHARDVIAKLHQGRIDPSFVRHGLALSAILDGTPSRVTRPKLTVVG